MNEFSLLFKLILKNTFRGYGGQKSTKKKKLAIISLVLVGFLPLLVIFCGVIFFLSRSFASLGYHAGFLSVLMSASQLLIVFFGIQSVLSYTFMSKDNEFLLQLPVKPLTLFLVKFTIIYLEELIISVLILLPGLVTYIIAVSQVITLPVYFYLLIPLMIAFAPVIPLIVVTLLSFPLMRLINMLKNKSGLSLLLLTGFFLCIMAVYFFAVPSIGMNIDSFSLDDKMVTSFLRVGEILYYNKVLAYAACGVNALLNLGLFILILAVSGGLMCLISITFYRKSALSQLEAPSGTASKEINVQSESADKALFRREVKNLFGDVNFAFNSIMGSLMTPLMVGFMGFMGINESTEPVEEGMRQMTALGAELMNVGMLIMNCMIVLVGINYSAALAVSREGSTFYINKYLPVEPVKVIKAKILLADIISMVGVALVFLVKLFLPDISFLNLVFAIGLITVFALAFNRLDIYRDLKKPNLSWNNANEVIKKNLYPMIPMFIALGLGVAFIALFGIVSELETAIGGVAVQLIVWAVSYAVGIACLALFSRKLNKNAVDLFNKINVN